MPNQTKFNLTIDNFYSLQPDTIFAKPRATVNFYIDNEVCFKEFDGDVFVKGKKDPVFFKDKNNNELENFKTIVDDNLTTITVSHEDLSAFGLEGRIEAQIIPQKPPSYLRSGDYFNSTITPPTKNQAAQNSVQISNKKIESRLAFGQLFLRNKGSQDNWSSFPAVRRQYLFLGTNELFVRLPQGFIGHKGEDLPIAFTIKTPSEQISLKMYDYDTRALQTLALVNPADGTIRLHPNDYHTPYMESIEFSGGPIVVDKEYTFTLKNLKTTRFLSEPNYSYYHNFAIRNSHSDAAGGGFTDKIFDLSIF